MQVFGSKEGMTNFALWDQFIKRYADDAAVSDLDDEPSLSSRRSSYVQQTESNNGEKVSMNSTDLEIETRSSNASLHSG